MKCELKCVPKHFLYFLNFCLLKNVGWWKNWDQKKANVFNIQYIQAVFHIFHSLSQSWMWMHFVSRMQPNFLLVIGVLYTNHIQGQRWAVFEILVFQICIWNTFCIWYLKYCKLSIFYFGILNTFLVSRCIYSNTPFKILFPNTFNMREQTLGY